MERHVGETRLMHTLTNTSDYYLVVGNCDKIISVHSDAKAAAAALNDLPDGGTVAYADVLIVAPGQTVTRQYVAPVTVPDERPTDWSSFFAPEDL